MTMVSIGLKGNSGVHVPQRSLTGTSGRAQPLPDELPHVDEAVIRYVHAAIRPTKTQECAPFLRHHMGHTTSTNASSLGDSECKK